MASWNSIPLELTYEFLGWFGFSVWSISFYPQVFLNYRRKSVVGLNFDFVLLNLAKLSSYLIYNASIYFSPTVQKQYFEQFGDGEMIPVAANDVAFSAHAVLLTLVTAFQILIYDRGTQKLSKVAIGIVSVVLLTDAVCFALAVPTHSWLRFLYNLNTLQVFLTVVKYIPQAIMNFKRRSTDGFSITNILLDLSGAIASYGQMVVQSVDQGSWNNFYGNIGKLMLSLITVCFDSLFITQHFVLYAAAKKTCKAEAFVVPEEDDIKQHLLPCSDEPPTADNV
ncbi:hypothetical protein K1719_008648 [Acacia pycnantha]|nr:hypothetical protein K1719_008648 [Acacia pycnantha]